LIDGNRGGSATSPLGKTSGEPNDTFDDPIVAVFDSTGSARLQGMVEIDGDLDVFLLGSLDAGDRLIVDADTTGSQLDVSVGIFDGLQRLVYSNDDRGGPLERFLDSYVDWIVRHSSDSYYLVVTNAAFANASDRSGAYLVDVDVSSGFAVPPPVPQVLVLDFDGGVVNSPPFGPSPIFIDSFDAGAIDSVYRGRTEDMKEHIRATVQQNYERFNVIVLTTDDAPPQPGQEFSTVFFGGFNGQVFGEAESVDLYNADFCDDAIIYTESFALDAFSFVPTAEGMSIAIGNVASHEAGHVLGLNHVDDDRALMDDRSPADVFVTDQEFMEAELSRDIMSIGTQDAVLLLMETVGPAGP